MAKFKVGDRAKIIHLTIEDMSCPVKRNLKIGIEVTIVDCGNILDDSGNPADVVCEVGSDTYYWTCMEDQLEPIVELGSWDELQKTINWNPTKELIYEI